MKKLILSIFILAAAGIASAQPVAPISATFSTQNLVDQLDVGRQVYNRDSGLQNYIEVEVVKPLIPAFKEAKSIQARADARTKCLSANKAAKDAICAAFDMAADCGLCDAFQ